jgi:hypothetical protein
MLDAVRRRGAELAELAERDQPSDSAMTWGRFAAAPFDDLASAAFVG